MALQEGINTKVYAPAGHAEGDGGKVWGDAAHAEGLNPIVIGDQAHVEGNATTSSENYGHAEGASTVAGNTPRTFTVSGTTVTIQGAVDDEFSNSNSIRFFELTGGVNNTLNVADRTISAVTVNGTGTHTMYVGQGSNNNPANLYSVNKGTGAQTLIGTFTCSGQNVSITGMAMDPTTGIMYAVSGGASPNFANSLFTLNLSTAVLTLIGTLEVIQTAYPFANFGGAGTNPDIAFDRHGQLWGSSINTGELQVALAAIDKTTGEELIYKIDQQLSNTVGCAFAFMNIINGGNDANRLFLLSGNGSSNTFLYEINPTTFIVQNKLLITGPANVGFVAAMKFDETNTLYAVSNKSGTFALYTINITTGASTSVALSRDYDSLGVNIAMNTTFTISSALDDRTGGMAVNKAAGQDDHAEGQSTNANLGLAHAQGYKCVALGNGAHAEGWLTVSTGAPSHAEGLSTFATGYCSHTEGNGNSALQPEGHAEGKGCASRAQAAHAEGIQTVAAGNWAHAEGGTALAYGDSSHAEGGSTQVNSEGGHAEGENNTVGNVRRPFTVSGTTVTITGINVTSEFANGQPARFADLLGGTNQTLYYADRTVSSLAFSGGNTTFTISSALDDRTSGVCFYQAIGQTAHAEGSSNSVTGFAAHVEGEQNTCSAETAHCEGDQNTASGFAAHCEGTGNTSTGLASHCEGDSCNSTNTASHAEGNSTTASGNGSHSEGSGTTASGTAAHAEGSSCTASADFTHAQGAGASAYLYGQDAQTSLGSPGQITNLTVGKITSNATATELFLDGSSLRMVLPDTKLWGYFIQVAARRSDTFGDNAYFELHGLISRGSGAGTTAIVTGTTTTINQGSSGTWTAVASADTTNGSLKLTVTGETGKTIVWDAGVRLIEN